MGPRGQGVVGRGRSWGKAAPRGEGSPSSSLPGPESPLPPGLCCAGGQGAQSRCWHGCPHRQGVSHNRWPAHLHLGAGGGRRDPGSCGFAGLSVGVCCHPGGSLRLPAFPIKGLGTA